MKPAATLTIALALALPGPVSAQDPLREESRLDRPAAGLRAIEVQNASGLIQVGPSADGAIHLVALKVVRSESEARRRELASLTRVEVDEREGRWVVQVRYPQRQRVKFGLWDLLRGKSVEFPEVEVRLALEVPGSLPVVLHSASGDLVTERLQGSQSLDTSSGDVEVSGARGALTVSTTSGEVRVEDARSAALRTVSGDVSVEGIAGPVRARTSSGELVVRDAGDSVHVETVSGDLEIGSAPAGLVAVTTSGDLTIEGPVAGAVRIESANGDVSASLSRGVTHAEVRTVSGAQRIALDDGLAADLEVVTTSGSLDVALEMAVREASRTRIRGRVGKGGVPVMLRSTSGDIDVVSGRR